MPVLIRLGNGSTCLGNLAKATGYCVVPLLEETPQEEMLRTPMFFISQSPRVSHSVSIRPAKSRPSVNCNSMFRLVFIEFLQRLYERIKRLLPRTLCLPASSSTFSSSSSSIILCSIKKYSSVRLILSYFPDV